MTGTGNMGGFSRRQVLLGAVGASAAMLGSTAFPDFSRAAPGGTLRVAVASLIDQSVDPFFQNGGLARAIGWHLYNMLFRFDDRGQRELDLAEGFEISGDRKTVTFKLRKDAVFWDGTPVTAEDVAWSIPDVDGDVAMDDLGADLQFTDRVDHGGVPLGGRARTPRP